MRQRSRVEWLAMGDKNTRFFLLRASIWKRKNLFKALQKMDGDLTDVPVEMQSVGTGVL